MTPIYQSITKLISEADLAVLMDTARSASDLPALWASVQDRLAAPSSFSRKTVCRMFAQWHLDGTVPSAAPVVLAWHAFPDPTIRREIVHLERCRHLGLVDDFVRAFLHPCLQTDNACDLSIADVDAYVAGRLPTVARSAQQATRMKLSYLLIGAGILQRKESDREGWRCTHYHTTWQGWLYGLYRELEDTGNRKRSEHYVVHESLLTRRLLLKTSDATNLVVEAVRRGALEYETFAGERYVRLVHPDVAGLIRALSKPGGV